MILHMGNDVKHGNDYVRQGKAATLGNARCSGMVECSIVGW